MLLQQHAPTSVGVCDEQFNVMLGTAASVKVFFIVYVSYVETLLTEHDNKIINVSITAYIILYKPSGAGVIVFSFSIVTQCPTEVVLIILEARTAEGPTHTGSIIYCNIRNKIINVKIINSKATAQYLRYNELNIEIFVSCKLS